jgi:Leucine-rich repeat (LRR) protein
LYLQNKKILGASKMWGSKVSKACNAYNTKSTNSTNSISLAISLPDDIVAKIFEMACESIKNVCQLQTVNKQWLRCSKIPVSYRNCLASAPRLKSDNFVQRLFTQFPQIHQLNLTMRDVTDSGIVQNIPTKCSLTELQLSHTAITNATIAHISTCQFLTVLELDDCPGITDECCLSLAKLSSLTELSLYDMKISDAGVAHFESYQFLKSLNLNKFSGTDGITDKGCESLSKIKSLTELNLAGCGGITDKGCESLAKLQSLIKLDLCDSSITNAGVGHLEESLHCLESLNLSYCSQITDDCCKSLAKFKSLDDLDLSATSISKVGLKHLDELGLVSLNIHGCEEVDDDCLQMILTSFTSMDSIYIDKYTSVTEDYVRDAMLKHPHIYICYLFKT